MTQFDRLLQLLEDELLYPPNPYAEISAKTQLELLDGQIPENNGTFAVTFENGRAVRVEKTEEKADVTLGINAFSALICGTSDWRDAVQWMPDVTLHRENPALEGVFYRKKLWIGDYF